MYNYYRLLWANAMQAIFPYRLYSKGTMGRTAHHQLTNLIMNSDVVNCLVEKGLDRKQEADHGDCCSLS